MEKLKTQEYKKSTIARVKGELGKESGGANMERARRTSALRNRDQKTTPKIKRHDAGDCTQAHMGEGQWEEG